MRTYLYVNGFYLYYVAVKDAICKWLNIHHLCQLLLPKNQILKILYFTALILHQLQPDDPQMGLDVRLIEIKGCSSVEDV